MSSTDEVGTSISSGRSRLGTRKVGYTLLVGLGLGYVIAGQYAAWNFGLARGGLYGLLAAFLIATVMYAALTSVLAELASMMPTAGGGYTFARRAFGSSTGFLVGALASLEYLLATSGVSVFIAAYLQELTGHGGWAVIVSLYAACVMLHLRGVTKALWVTLLLTITAALGVAVFLGASMPHFSVANLTQTSAAPSFNIAQHVALQAWAALPFAIGFYLGIEGLPLAAEEVADPTRNVPRGMRAVLRLTAFTSVVTAVVATATAGATVLGDAPAPLIATLRSVHAASGLVMLVNLAGLVALMSGFFAAMFACSRQLFALARAGHLPAALARTNSHGAPALATLVSGVVGSGLALSGSADKLVVLTVLFAALTYVVMFVVHARLRLKEPNTPRPFRSRGGWLTTIVGLTFAAAALVACVRDNLRWALYAAMLLAVLLMYEAFFGRREHVPPAAAGSKPNDVSHPFNSR